MERADHPANPPLRPRLVHPPLSPMTPSGTPRRYPGWMRQLGAVIAKSVTYEVHQPKGSPRSSPRGPASEDRSDLP